MRAALALAALSLDRRQPANGSPQNQAPGRLPALVKMVGFGATSSALLPDELWVEVLGHLEARDLGRSACACRGFARISELVWRSLCFKLWPRWAAIAAEPGTQWRRQ